MDLGDLSIALLPIIGSGISVVGFTFAARLALRTQKYENKQADQARDQLRQAEAIIPSIAERRFRIQMGEDATRDPELAQVAEPEDGTLPTGTWISAEPPITDEDLAALPPLSALWHITQKRLDYYHQIATNQARQSFRNAKVAMWVGFVILVGGAILAAQSETATGKIVVGSMGAAAAALAGFVSRTFIRSQESSATHLRAYFTQPLEFSRYLYAQGLIAEMEPEHRAQATTELVKALAASPPAPEARESTTSPEKGTEPK